MDEESEAIELIEQREIESVPAQFVERFFGRLAAELPERSHEVPGDAQARRFPLEIVGATVKCLVVRVDVRRNDATVELTIESFDDDAVQGARVGDRDALVATLWRAAQQAARTDPLPS